MASLVLPGCNASFLHIPKTAGYSVSTAIKGAFADTEPCPTRGMNKLTGAAQHVGERLGYDIFARTWSFCFIRNPWDWAVSGWLFITRTSAAYGKDAPDFDSFIKGTWPHAPRHNPQKAKFTSPELFVAFHTLATQSDHLLGPDGVTPVPMAFYARFEHLAADWTRICERLGRDMPLPHLNQSERTPYTDYYTDELRDIVAQRNAGFIERFGYKFGD